MNASELIDAQREREPRSITTAAGKAASIEVRSRPITDALRRADRAARPGKRIRLILQAADAWADQIAPFAACRRGCDHCCHIPLTITTAEARLLSQVSGRPMTVPAHAAPLRNLDEVVGFRDRLAQLRADQDQLSRACPFLRDGACCVYEHRPVACRTHFNLDVDDLLCQVVPGHPANVPYANTTQIAAACLVRQSEECVADIRDFFP